MIKVVGVSKEYSGISVLNKIDLIIPDKKISGIIGPNGAGKSTLIKIISGFETQDSGEIFFNNNKVDEFYEKKRFVSYMPEYMLLYPELFVKEFIDYFHKVMRFSNDKLIKMLNLKNVFNKRIKHLSKGWHQRLKLYTALSNEKPYVILDEPFEGFDPIQMNDIMKLFDVDKTFILSIHQLSQAQRICDYFILLDNGNLIASGSMEELKKRFSCESDSLEDIFIKALSS